jgi:hypothetical protein
MATNPSYYPSPPPSSGDTGGGNWIPAAVGGLASSWISAKQQKKEREHRTQTEADRRRYDLEQWHRSNRYNHPLEQIQRLRDAGLNPNLIYGSSPGSAVGNAGSVHPGKAPEYKLTDPIGPGANLFMDTREKQAQTNNIKGDTLLKATQSLETARKADIKGHELRIIEESAGAIIEGKKHETELKRIDILLKDGLRPHQIANAMSMAEKNALAKKLLDIDLDQASAGYVKGNYIGTILKGVYGLDMRNEDDQLKAKVIVTAILGSQVINNLGQTMKTMLETFFKKGKR